MSRVNGPSLSVIAGSLCFAWLSQCTPAAAQAIDCAKPANATQQTICGDADLKALDAKMVSLYESAMNAATPAQKKEIPEQQKRWADTRDACAKDADVKSCVTKSYENRNTLLAEYADKAFSAPATGPVTFLCTDKSKLLVEFLPGGDKAKVTYGASTWTLPQVKTGSGARYADDKVSVWNKGKEVTFEQDGKPLTCTASQ